MLVLTRLANEEIMIGDDIRITVVAVNGNQVRIGVTAPRHLAVHRREVYEEICEENVKAAEVTPEKLRGLKHGLPPPAAPFAATCGRSGAGEDSDAPLPHSENEPGSS